MGNRHSVVSQYSSPSELRYLGGFVENMESKMQQIILTQSKFPVSIREAINDAKGLNPEQFFEYMDEVMNQLFTTSNGTSENAMKGLDYSVDTEEEVEFAIRAFPNFMPRNWTWQPETFEALPFFPLVIELTVEITGYWNLVHIFGNWATFYDMIKIHERERTEEEIALQLNDVFHLFLIRLKENCLSSVSFQEICGGADTLCCTGYRFEQKTLCFLLDWKPTILEVYRSEGFGIRSPFLHFYLQTRLAVPMGYLLIGHDGLWMMFQVIFEGGMSNYPNELGFLFHKSFENKRISFVLYFDRVAREILRKGKPFKDACNAFGKERVTKLVNKNILRITKAKSYAIRALFVMVGSNPKIDVDGIYFLLRFDPAALVPAIHDNLTSVLNEGAICRDYSVNSSGRVPALTLSRGIFRKLAMRSRRSRTQSSGISKY